MTCTCVRDNESCLAEHYSEKLGVPAKAEAKNIAIVFGSGVSERPYPEIDFEPDTAQSGSVEASHSDDAYVDGFAEAMKAKMAASRAKGRGGWEACSADDLSRMLREHIEKGDPRDVANFCMMLHHKGAAIAAEQSGPVGVVTDAEIQLLWDVACKDSPGKPGWSRHIRFARAILARAAAQGSEDKRDAVAEACATLYFDDSSKYKGALGNIVRMLRPDLYALMEEGKYQAAFDLSNAERTGRET